MTPLSSRRRRSCGHRIPANTEQTDRGWQQSTNSSGERFHEPDRIRPFIEDKVEHTYAGLERWIKLAVLRIAGVIHKRHGNSLAGKTFLDQVRLRRGSGEIMTGAGLFAQINQLLGLVAQELVVHRPGDGGVNPEKPADRIDEATIYLRKGSLICLRVEAGEQFFRG